MWVEQWAVGAMSRPQFTDQLLLASMLINKANPAGSLATSSSPSEINDHIVLWYTEVKCRVHCMYTQTFCVLRVFYSVLYCESNKQLRNQTPLQNGEHTVKCTISMIENGFKHSYSLQWAGNKVNRWIKTQSWFLLVEPKSCSSVNSPVR